MVELDAYDAMAEATKTTALAIADEQVTALVKKEKTPPLSVSDKEALLIQGDLERLSSEGRLAYYLRRCHDLRLDPLSRPFDYIRVPGVVKGTYKLVLYANKNCAEQLREAYHLSSVIIKEETETGIHRVYVRARKPIIVDNVIIGYREFDDLGAVAVAGIGGDALANARMRAVTKAHRRAVLGICGVGMSDESEIETIRGAVRITPEEVDALSKKFESNNTAKSSAPAEVTTTNNKE